MIESNKLNSIDCTCPNCSSISISDETVSLKRFGISHEENTKFRVCNNCRIRFLDEVKLNEIFNS